MLKWLLLIFIIPSLLFGKLYGAIEQKINNSHNHMEACYYAEESDSDNHYFHIHEHDHENGVESHSHSHNHATKTFNVTDSFFFFMEQDDFTSALKDRINTRIDAFISSKIIKDLFRPPIA